MNVHIGSWAFPLVFTIVAFFVAHRAAGKPGGGDYAAIGYGIGWAFYNLLAIIASLIVWLAWALLR